MKLVISDYPDVLRRDLDREAALLRADLPDAAVVVHPYRDSAAFLREMADADGLLTAFLPIDRAMLDAMPRLRAISLNATGYNTVDLEETRRRGIPVCAIGEYCTEEVADHAFALLLALERGLKTYFRTVDSEQRWQYYAAPPPMGLSRRTLGLFGFGRIGQAVARRGRGFGLRVLAADPHASAAQAETLGVQLCDTDTILREADIISCHMNLTAANTHYFDDARFARMERQPIFLNVARGGLVDSPANKKQGVLEKMNPPKRA